VNQQTAPLTWFADSGPNFRYLPSDLSGSHSRQSPYGVIPNFPWSARGQQIATHTNLGLPSFKELDLSSSFQESIMTDFQTFHSPLPHIPDNLTVAQFMLDHQHEIRPIRNAQVPCLVDDHTGHVVDFEMASFSCFSDFRES